MTYELKTKLNDESVEDYLKQIDDEQKQNEAFVLLNIFERLAWEKWNMWWDSIVGFWTYSYTNSTGKSFTWMRTGFSPRKTAFSLYIMPGYQFDEMEELLSKLGKYKTGRSCLYIKKLSDIDLKVLEKIITFGLDDMKKRYP